MPADERLDAYIRKGVEDIVLSAVKATLTDPRESAFMVRYAAASRRAAKRRDQWAEQGEHIPPFLIASITSQCNLHCAGCYARADGACHDGAALGQMTAEEWAKVFAEARDLGVGFILLAGGEPMLRRDILEAAGDFPELLFPVFTNGTLLDAEYLTLLDHRRNLVPVLSIEGDRAATDGRRGDGVYDALTGAMEALQSRGLIFGASVTVTTENLEEVLSRTFLEGLRDRGCRAVFFVEFVPVTDEAAHLAPGEAERAYILRQVELRRAEIENLLMISFPGDEAASGGCLAAGRGFFHINAYGGAEPCPFSPYSDASVKKDGLLSAMHSRLFTALREGELLQEDHKGGCVLFEARDRVEAILGVHRSRFQKVSK